VSAEPVTSEAARLLTAEDVAARWQVPKSQIYRLCRDGKLPAVEIGRYRRWRLEAIEAFEREGGAAYA
jgi:excisionase family DNA binding protein